LYGFSRSIARINTRRAVCPPTLPPSPRSTRHYRRHRSTVTECISRSVCIIIANSRRSVYSTTCVLATVKSCITTRYFIIRGTWHNAPKRKKYPDAFSFLFLCIECFFFRCEPAVILLRFQTRFISLIFIR